MQGTLLINNLPVNFITGNWNEMEYNLEAFCSVSSLKLYSKGQMCFCDLDIIWLQVVKIL
jgi:hypothetical protein